MDDPNRLTADHARPRCAPPWGCDEPLLGPDEVVVYVDLIVKGQGYREDILEGTPWLVHARHDPGFGHDRRRQYVGTLESWPHYRDQGLSS
jgi:hypothetical protein